MTRESLETLVQNSRRCISYHPPNGRSSVGTYVNALTGKPSTPHYTAIIDAVTRREKASFLPDGMTAANQLGLTDAVPAKITVRTDARLRPIRLDKLVIDFKLTAPSRLYWSGRPAMRIAQALHWLHDMQQPQPRP